MKTTNGIYLGIILGLTVLVSLASGTSLFTEERVGWKEKIPVAGLYSTSPVREARTEGFEDGPLEIGKSVGSFSKATLSKVAIRSVQKPVAENKILLETIRGGRHKGYVSIVFQLSKKANFSDPQVTAKEIRFQLHNVTTKLTPFRKYRTFDSWVRLEGSGENLKVYIGVPNHFSYLKTLLLEKPDRLVVNLFIIEGAVLSKSTGEPKTVPAEPPPDRESLGEKGLAVDKVTSVLSNERQIDLIRARILSRQGFYEKSLDIYRGLRQRHPDDEEIWEDYVETLVNDSHYDLALYEITKLLQKNPSNLRGQRIQARIYYEAGLYGWTFPIYEEILRLYQKDLGVWSDYAFAQQGSGEWVQALDYFCRILEQDPENRSALRAVHEILRGHRPSLETGYRPYTQEADKSNIDLFYLRYSQHITTKTNIDLSYDRFSAYRPKGPEGSQIFGVDEKGSDLTVRLRHWFGQRWQGRVGGGMYSGLGGGKYFLLGASYSFLGRGILRADYVSRRPWYNPVEAARLDGHFDRASASFDWNFGPLWGLHLGVEQGDYNSIGPDLRSVGKYGRKRSFTGILTRKLWDRPDLYVGYSFYRSKFFYRYKDFRPISMIESEAVHSLFFDFVQWPCTYWGYSLSAGIRRDTARKITSWYAVPGIKVRLGNRIEAGLSYEYSTESETSALGGKTETIYLGVKVIL